MVPYTCNIIGGLNMPEYKGKHFPYTKKGKRDAAAARAKGKAAGPAGPPRPRAPVQRKTKYA